MPLDLITGESDDESEDFSFDRMLGNIIPSGKQFVDDLTYPIRHPIDTVKGLNQIGSGIGQMLASDNPEAFVSPANVGAAKAVKQFYIDRYGGVNNLKNTIENDPVGFVSDLSTILTGGAAAASNVGGKVGSGAAAIRKVAAALDPAAMPTNLAKALPSKSIYKTGMKFKYGQGKGKVTQSEASNLANQAYDLELRPNDVGMDTLADEKIRRGQAIDQSVRDMPQDPIPVDEIGRFLPDERAKMLGTGQGSKRSSYVDQFDSATEDYLNRVVDANGDTMTPMQMQGAKIGRYSEAGPAAYGDAPKFPAEVQANKTMGRGAKEAIESRNPKVRALNKAYADVKKMGDALPFNSPSAFGTDYSSRVVAGSAGMGQVPTSMVGFMSHLLRTKAIDAALAIKWAGKNPTKNNILRQASRQAGIQTETADEAMPEDLLEKYGIGESN